MPTERFPPRHKPWAWRGLMSLDGSIAAREELAEAGVAQRRISALYPPCFADLVPGLMLHLREQGGSHIYLRGDAEALDKLIIAAEETLWSDEEARCWREQEADTSLEELREHLLQTWLSNSSEPQPDFTAAYSNILWRAWWFMMNYAQLTEDAQKAGDQLLAAADQVWRLPKPGVHHV